MAPTVYIADIGGCDQSSDSDNNSSDGEDKPTLILGFGASELRGRKRNMIQRRERRPLAGLTARTSRRQSTPDDQRITRNSIDGNECHLASISRNSLPSAHAETYLKSWPRSSLCHRLFLLKRRAGLLDISVRTVALIRRNQQLQIRLAALQAETSAFVRSVMNNPENQGVKLHTSQKKSEDSNKDISKEIEESDKDYAVNK